MLQFHSSCVTCIDTAYFFKISQRTKWLLVILWSWKSNLKSSQDIWLKADQESTNLRLWYTFMSHSGLEEYYNFRINLKNICKLYGLWVAKKIQFYSFLLPMHNAGLFIKGKAEESQNPKAFPLKSVLFEGPFLFITLCSKAVTVQKISWRTDSVQSQNSCFHPNCLSAFPSELHRYPHNSQQ